MNYCCIDADSIAYAAAYGETLEQMEWTCDKYVRDILEATRCDDYYGYIESPYGDKANFRKWVAVSREYKGTRKGRPKPQWLQPAKEHLHTKWNFHYVRTMESEDAATIKAHELGRDRCIIAAIDKDILMHPGVFYNYNKHEFQTVGPLEAHRNLHIQLLRGDPTDNILGLGGIGPKKAAAILDAVDPAEWTHAVAREYIAHGQPYAYFNEIARLVYILKKRGEVFTPLTMDDWQALEEE